MNLNHSSFSVNSFRLFLVKDFLNAAECEHLASALKKQLDEDETASTNQNCDFFSDKLPLLQEIDERLCKLVAIDSSYAEPLLGHYCDAKGSQANVDLHDLPSTIKSDSLRGSRAYAPTIVI